LGVAFVGFEAAFAFAEAVVGLEEVVAGEEDEDCLDLPLVVAALLEDLAVVEALWILDPVAKAL